MLVAKAALPPRHHWRRWRRPTRLATMAAPHARLVGRPVGRESQSAAFRLHRTWLRALP